MKYEKMTKTQMLAAETFAYSYANYADHLGVNLRFDKYMPDDIKIIENIVRQGSGGEKKSYQQTMLWNHSGSA